MFSTNYSFFSRNDRREDSPPLVIFITRSDLAVKPSYMEGEERTWEKGKREKLPDHMIQARK
jgi:hypothetical protein